MHSSTSSPGRVLVTGSAGRLGQAALQGLRTAEATVRGFDRQPTPGIADSVIGSLTDVSALRVALSDVDTVIHLAATPDDDEFESALVPNNVIGLHHVLEESCRAGVRRVLLASSGQVNWWQQTEGPWPIHPSDPLTPRHWYAATKIFLEAAGKAFSHGARLQVLIVRLGWCPRTPAQAAELAATPHARDIYLSPGDAARFFSRAVATREWPAYSIVYVASRPVALDRFSLEPTRQLLGWEPQDRWPEGLDPGWPTEPDPGLGR